jgi:hypothetical protein
MQIMAYRLIRLWSCGTCIYGIPHSKTTATHAVYQVFWDIHRQDFLLAVTQADQGNGHSTQTRDYIRLYRTMTRDAVHYDSVIGIEL